jgi:predicted cobalt transporter CbtA
MAYERTTERVETVEHDRRPAAGPAGEAHESRTVTTDPFDERRDSAWRVGQIVYLVFGVGIALIAIRFVLLLLGANPDAGFTNLVYSVTGPLVAPFEGIFGAPSLETGVFDPASLVAIVVYALVGWVSGKVLSIALGETRSATRTRTSRVDIE